MTRLGAVWIGCNKRRELSLRLIAPGAWALEPILFVGGTLFVIKGNNYLPKFFSGSEVILVTSYATLLCTLTIRISCRKSLSWNPMLVFPVWRTPILTGRVHGCGMEVRWWIPLAGPGPCWLFSATLFAAVNFLSIGHCVWVESEDGPPWNASGVACAGSELWSRGRCRVCTGFLIPVLI
jgi:hypothetical protein